MGRCLASGKMPATLEDQIRITGEMLQDLHNGLTFVNMCIILLDVLLCIIAEYFYELCRILTNP